MSEKEKHNLKFYVNEPMALYVTKNNGSLFNNLFGSNSKQVSAMSDFDMTAAYPQWLA